MHDPYGKLLEILYKKRRKIKSIQSILFTIQIIGIFLILIGLIMGAIK